MKRMLFNATQQEELRVAIVDGQKLIDIDIETTGREQRKSNIYKGIITRIEPSLEACFVNYGEDRHGFLPFKEVSKSYFKEGVDFRSVNIRDALYENQEIMVQVEKEERGNKGAALTSFISLAGRYLVLMPNNPRGGGVSRRVEGEERQELKDSIDKLDLPNGMSVIARTAGIGRNINELQWDLNYLLKLWDAVDSANKSSSGPFLIYQESSLVIRAIRDYYQPDIGEILIDTDEIFDQAKQFMDHVMPDMTKKVKRYSDEVPLFSRFQIEHQIESAYSRIVQLPSGGAIVIDHTEALVSIDVNSARATKGTDIETTAFNTNLEAAEEVARQLRLRDLGGLIVIDFIDMDNIKNQREIENNTKDALYHDRARVQMGKISRFGLMELSRQRLRPSLSDGSHVTCPRCNGTGHIRDTESSALQVLRIIQEEAMKENSASIHIQCPIEVTAFLLNEKRGEILKIEIRHRVLIILIPNKYIETPHFKLERIKTDDPNPDDIKSSYKMVENPDTYISYNFNKKIDQKPRQKALLKTINPDQPAPVSKNIKSKGNIFNFFKEIFQNIILKIQTDTKLKNKSSEKRKSKYKERINKSSSRNRGKSSKFRDKKTNLPKEKLNQLKKNVNKNKENDDKSKVPNDSKLIKKKNDNLREKSTKKSFNDKKNKNQENNVFDVPETLSKQEDHQKNLNSNNKESADDTQNLEIIDDLPKKRRRRGGGRGRNRREHLDIKNIDHSNNENDINAYIPENIINKEEIIPILDNDNFTTQNKEEIFLENNQIDKKFHSKKQTSKENEDNQVIFKDKEKNIDEILKSSGLMMAVTDPEKLKASQNKNIKKEKPKKIERRRKKETDKSSETLIQVETQR